MEKVKRFFRNFNEKRSYRIVFFVVSMCVILGLYGGVSYKISYKKMITVTEDKNLVKYIEDVKFENEKLSISGWCFYRNIDSNKCKIRVLLRNLADENDIIWLDTQRVARNDVGAYYGGTVDYSQAGFIASKAINNLYIEESNYEIMITFVCDEDIKDSSLVMKSNKKVKGTVATNRYISKGNLSAVNPIEDVEPERGTNDNFNEILDRGHLLVYREDYGMYIYQYGKKIYWIANNKFHFENDGTTGIQYRVDTTDTDRVENSDYFENLSFVFEYNEINMNGIPYRVAAREIPTSYSVTSIETGYHTGSKWMWREYLNLDIRDILN